MTQDVKRNYAADGLALGHRARQLGELILGTDAEAMLRKESGRMLLAACLHEIPVIPDTVALVEVAAAICGMMDGMLPGWRDDLSKASTVELLAFAVGQWSENFAGGSLDDALEAACKALDGLDAKEA